MLMPFTWILFRHQQRKSVAKSVSWDVSGQVSILAATGCGGHTTFARFLPELVTSHPRKETPPSSKAPHHRWASFSLATAGWWRGNWSSRGWLFRSSHCPSSDCWRRPSEWSQQCIHHSAHYKSRNYWRETQRWDRKHCDTIFLLYTYLYIILYRYTWQEAITLFCGSNILLVFTKALCSRRGLVGLPISQSPQSPASRSWQCIPCWLPSMQRFDLQEKELGLLGVLLSFRVISFWFMRSNVKTLPSAACLLVLPQFHSAKTTTAQQANAFEFASLDLGSILGQTSIAHGAVSVWGEHIGVPTTSSTPKQHQHQQLSTTAQKQDIEELNAKKDPTTIHIFHQKLQNTSSQTYTKREQHIIQGTSLCFWSCTFRPLSTFPSRLNDIFQRAQQQVEGFAIQDQALGLGKCLAQRKIDWRAAHDVLCMWVHLPNLSIWKHEYETWREYRFYIWLASWIGVRRCYEIVWICLKLPETPYWCRCRNARAILWAWPVNTPEWHHLTSPWRSQFCSHSPATPSLASAPTTGWCIAGWSQWDIKRTGIQRIHSPSISPKKWTVPALLLADRVATWDHPCLLQKSGTTAIWLCWLHFSKKAFGNSPMNLKEQKGLISYMSESSHIRNSHPKHRGIAWPFWTKKHPQKFQKSSL